MARKNTRGKVPASTPIQITPFQVWQLEHMHRELKKLKQRQPHDMEVVLDPEKDPRWKRRGEE
ncbi:MAG: hypothetical protein ACXWQO_07995 [Bdellovibrionota bacterium]